jgi:hypothetical protein
MPLQSRSLRGKNQEAAKERERDAEMYHGGCTFCLVEAGDLLIW